MNSVIRLWLITLTCKHTTPTQIDRQAVMQTCRQRYTTSRRQYRICNHIFSPTIISREYYHFFSSKAVTNIDNK